ncbi:OLC1v1023946C1 [Oldenlandia corymbosa var. corymbosa]|uniref:OLC1v1023946C1 n=1 Tax=Oldenlandia corymbosa var. corymbosa TaxID=529605 RepID=A0AAV1C141_OLDCO|nr:OLC1v1023946C1 [Oldenlandia corymbosa var. corymbosa]
MAEALVVDGVKFLVGKVISVATPGIFSVFGFEKEVESLGASARQIEAVLADAEKKETESEVVRLWLDKVESVAFDASNVFSELNYQIIRQQVKSINKYSKWGKVLLFFSSPTYELRFRMKMSSKIREVNAKLTSCNLKANEIGLIRNALMVPGPAEEVVSVVSRQTNSLVPDLVVGRDKEVSEIVAKLLGFCDKDGVYTLPIVATLVSSHGPAFFLEKLGDDGCWSVITRKATKDGTIPGELNALKDQILKRCQGLPLAANVIGGLLSLQKKEDWFSIVKDKILKFGGDHEGATGIMQLWMAEGFLDLDRGASSTMEEIGGNYLRILVQSSLLEKTDYYSKYHPTYRIHDLVHDLTVRVSKPKRSLVLDSFRRRKQNQVLTNAESVRTLFVKGSISDEMLSKYKSLRLLKASWGNITDYLPAISTLNHLTHLDLSHSKIKVLPESICKLYNLQTLRLKWCYDLQVLPRGMKNLISLRHLQYINYDKKFQMPPELGRLSCLQTLEFFNVGEVDEGRGIQELGPMKQLEGSLVIRNLELVQGKEAAKVTNLSKKQNLIALGFEWGSSEERRDGTETCDEEEVLECLKPHPNLQELRIVNFMGNQFPEWLGKLSSLTELQLQGCENCTQLSGLYNLRYLETLRFGKMRSLTEWKEAETVGGDDVARFPRLRELSISDCSQLSATPTMFPALHGLWVSGNVKPLVIKNILTSGVARVPEILIIASVDGLNCLSDVVGLLDHHNSFSHDDNHLTSLKMFCIFSCTSLTNIQNEILEGCSDLESFWVINCPNLVSCPVDLQETPSIQEFWFQDCPKLFIQNDTPRGFGHLPNLSEVSIGPFSNDSINYFDWSGLSSYSSKLKLLCLSGLYHTQLPDQFLQELVLVDFGALESLPDWLGDLVSDRIWK